MDGVDSACYAVGGFTSCALGISPALSFFVVGCGRTQAWFAPRLVRGGWFDPLGEPTRMPVIRKSPVPCPALRIVSRDLAPYRPGAKIAPGRHVDLAATAGDDLVMSTYTSPCHL